MGSIAPPVVSNASLSLGAPLRPNGYTSTFSNRSGPESSRFAPPRLRSCNVFGLRSNWIISTPGSHWSLVTVRLLTRALVKFLQINSSSVPCGRCGQPSATPRLLKYRRQFALISLPLQANVPEVEFEPRPWQWSSHSLPLTTCRLFSQN